MKALVTGGAGFIGSHVTDALVAAGHAVHVVDDLSSGRLANLESALELGAELHTEDVTDAAWMTSLAAIIQPDVVFHLAAQRDVRDSVDDPAFDAAVNVTGTAAVLDAARRAGARRFVLASTAAVYGRPVEIPTRETAPVEPISPYGASKAAAESYLALFTRLHGLSTVSLRMSNVYGPRQDPDGEAGVVAIFATAAATGSQALVFGDGLQTRDYLHVEDAVAAFVGAARIPVAGVFNVSTGRETPVLEVARRLGVLVEHTSGRHGEIDRSCLDPTRAAELLGWHARVSLETGLARLASPLTLRLTA